MASSRCFGRALALLLLGALAAPCWAAATMSTRHVMILRPGIDEVWGTYIFAVENPNETPQPFSSRIMLPVETADWRPEEGVSPQDFHLGNEGGVWIEKNFNKGTNIILLSFLVKGEMGQATLTLKAPYNFDELAILVKPGSMTLTNAALVQSQNVEFMDQRFDRSVWGNVKSGEQLVVNVGQLPEGRGRLWLTGGVFACLLFGLGITFAWRSRPQDDAATA